MPLFHTYSILHKIFTRFLFVIVSALTFNSFFHWQVLNPESNKIEDLGCLIKSYPQLINK